MESYRSGTPEWLWRLQLLLRARAMPAVAVTALLLFALVELFGGVQHLSVWYLEFGLRREDLLAGKFWQPATHAALHGSWWHVGVNALLLWWCGARLERILGGRSALAALVWCVLGGALAHLLLASASAGPLVGLSGGVMGLLLMLTTLSPQSKMLFLPLSARNLGLGVLIAEGALALCDPALNLPAAGKAGAWLRAVTWPGLFQIGHACHFGGALAGWLLARRILRPRVSLAELRTARRKNERKTRATPAGQRSPAD